MPNISGMCQKSDYHLNICEATGRPDRSGKYRAQERGALQSALGSRLAE